LAELDLGRRGAGDLFGTSQHGFGTLQYANWTNLTLVAQAQQLSTQLAENWQGIVPAVKVGAVVPLGN
jgi:RecG-like helicase